MNKFILMVVLTNNVYASHAYFCALVCSGAQPAPRSAHVFAWPVGLPHMSSPCPQEFPHTDARRGSC